MEHLPVPKRTKLGTGGHVQTQTAKSPVEGAFVAAAERLVTKAKRRAVQVASDSPSLRIVWGPKIPKPATVRNTTFFVKLYHKEHIFRS